MVALLVCHRTSTVPVPTVGYLLLASFTNLKNKRVAYNSNRLIAVLRIWNRSDPTLWLIRILNFIVSQMRIRTGNHHFRIWIGADALLIKTFFERMQSLLFRSIRMWIRADSDPYGTYPYHVGTDTNTDLFLIRVLLFTFLRIRIQILLYGLFRIFIRIQLRVFFVFSQIL